MAEIKPESSAIIMAVFRDGIRDTAITVALREHDDGSALSGSTKAISGLVDFLITSINTLQLTMFTKDSMHTLDLPEKPNRSWLLLLRANKIDIIRRKGLVQSIRRPQSSLPRIFIDLLYFVTLIRLIIHFLVIYTTNTVTLSLSFRLD